MDKDQVIAELFRRTRVAVDSRDPIFLIVELNRIILENEADITAGRISKVAEGFERIAQRNADDFIEAVNKTSSVLMNQITSLEAAALKVTVPEYIEKAHPSNESGASQEDSFKKQFFHWLLIASIFGAGLFSGLLIAGFMWVFFGK